MNTINNSSLPVNVALTGTVNSDLLKPVLANKSNKDGHSSSHGLGKIEDLYNRNLLSAEQNTDGTVTVSTATRNYTFSNSPLITRVIAEILGNSRSLDSELEWFEKNCITSNQVKLLGAETKPEKSKTSGGVSYVPVTAVDARDWLHNAMITNVAETSDVTAVLWELLDDIAPANVAATKKDKLVLSIQKLTSLLISTAQIETYKEIADRQTKELERFSFLTVKPTTPIKAIALDGTIQDGLFSVQVAAVDAKQLVTDCKTITGLTSTPVETIKGVIDTDTGIADIVAVVFKLDFTKVTV